MEVASVRADTYIIYVAPETKDFLPPRRSTMPQHYRGFISDLFAG